jgi:hypothetical protein
MPNLPKPFHSTGEQMITSILSPEQPITHKYSHIRDLKRAFFNGLVSEAHPHFIQLQKVCDLIDKLDALYDDEHALTYERCPNTGAYVDNDEALQSLTKEIHIVQQEIDVEELILVNTLMK